MRTESPDSHPLQLAEMVAVIAHEFRNPLTGIRAAIEMVGRHLPAPSTERAVIDEILERIDRLDGVVDDLLTFAESPEPHWCPVALEPVLNDVINSLGERHAAEFRILAHPTLPLVRGDEALLRTVFLNLLTNAVHAGGDRGVVEISFATEPSRVSVSIADHGPGFSTAAREALFRPFFTTKARGTGLGLPTARRLVELHGGRLAIESGADGASVVVTLPSAA